MKFHIITKARDHLQFSFDPNGFNFAVQLHLMRSTGGYLDADIFIPFDYIALMYIAPPDTTPQTFGMVKQ